MAKTEIKVINMNIKNCIEYKIFLKICYRRFNMNISTKKVVFKYDNLLK